MPYTFQSKVAYRSVSSQSKRHAQISFPDVKTKKLDAIILEPSNEDHSPLIPSPNDVREVLKKHHRINGI